MTEIEWSWAIVGGSYHTGLPVVPGMPVAYFIVPVGGAWLIQEKFNLNDGATLRVNGWRKRCGSIEDAVQVAVQRAHALLNERLGNVESHPDYYESERTPK